MKRINVLLVGLLTLMIGCDQAPKKNIILMIPDGTGVASLTVAREVKGAPLVLDQVMCGLVQTRSMSHTVTDSAAAGTAMSCGERTRNGAIAVSTENIPLLTFGEWARRQGKAVGIVTTDIITGATPSAFSAHAASRNDAEIILEQQITSDFDLFFAGGQTYLTEARKAMLQEEGFMLVQTVDELRAAQGRLFGLFAPQTMTPMVERRQGGASTEPTLAEMSAKALDLLSKDPDGFFLMIEGAQVDKGNHAHDIAWATYELLAFDEAVEAVLEWAKTREDTIVVIAPDHETGGLTIHDERAPGARGQAIQAIHQRAALPATECGLHYSTTWHSGSDVFLASNDPLLRLPRNCDFRQVLTGEGVQPLVPLTGTTETVEGVPHLRLEDGTLLRAHRDAIYIPATQAWYQR